MLVDVLLLRPLLLWEIVLKVLAREVEVVRALTVDKFDATAKGVVVLMIDDGDVDEVGALEVVGVTLDVELVFQDEVVNDKGRAGIGCDPRIKQPRSWYVSALFESASKLSARATLKCMHSFPP